MRVFICWSGRLSQRVADMLRKYLPLMIQDLDVFMSKHDLESGSRWIPELANQLEDTNFGLLCLTPDNLSSDWILFEAGALAKHSEGRACGILIGQLRPADVSGPLAQFQHRAFSKEDMEALLADLNAKMEKPLKEGQLKTIFEKWWPDIEGEYSAALAPERTAEAAPRVQRDLREIQEEILARIRDLERESARESARTTALGRVLLPRRWTFGTMAHSVVSDADVTRETPDAVKVAYVYGGQEFLSEVRRPGTEWRPLMDSLLERIQIPISEIRVYIGDKLVHSQKFGWGSASWGSAS